MGKKWSNKETIYLTKNLRKIPYKQIAKKLNRTERSVKMKVLHIGLALKKPRWTSYEVNKLKKLFKICKTFSTIGRKMNKSRFSISSKVRRLDLRNPA